ncbi:uncharacterized protein [Solanum tuberosum]|uniref:uncharacterized protein n=1 Tax=Solanum tuberosum TaxID=4113 RepID=UPI000739FBEF|nr:PREDICTED: uncharacterized protein LOC107060033 [Solanum tuberosum]
MIAHNLIMSHELIKGYGRTGISTKFMLKIYMQKAYDSVEWPYLQQIPQLLGIPRIFVACNMECITKVSYSILINEAHSASFPAKKGLRQGDPILHYLFVRAMEYLCRLVQGLQEDVLFKFHPRCSKQKITQLSFADDLLLFCNGNVDLVDRLFSKFNTFSRAFGLVANPTKSSTYFGGVSEEVQQQILRILGFEKGTLPFRYLGVTLSLKRRSVVQCERLIEKMIGRVGVKQADDETIPATTAENDVHDLPSTLSVHAASTPRAPTPYGYALLPLARVQKLETQMAIFLQHMRPWMKKSVEK